MKSRFFGDFPAGPVVKNVPYNPGDMGSTPGQGTKIPHNLMVKKLKHNTEGILY